MPGYLDDPEPAAAALTPDGWLHIGDLGGLDERGCLHIDDQRRGRRVGASQMANHKVPRIVEIVGELPLDATGKVMKQVLRTRAAPRSPA